MTTPPPTPAPGRSVGTPSSQATRPSAASGNRLVVTNRGIMGRNILLLEPSIHDADFTRPVLPWTRGRGGTEGASGQRRTDAHYIRNARFNSRALWRN